jgi:anti-sigma B factor antagonist
MQPDNAIRHIEATDEMVRVEMEGDLDLVSAPSAQASILAAAELDSRPKVVIDLSEVGFIDSAGLAMLISLHRSSLVNGRLLVVVEPKSQPDRVLKLGRFDTLIKIDDRTDNGKKTKPSGS